MCYSPTMTTQTQAEVDRLHLILARLYRKRRHTPAELTRIEGLWANIEKLESAVVKASARKDKA